MPLPPSLSSLLNRTRTGLLVLLVFVLPLQGVVQLVAGVQGHRHVHTGAQQAAVPWQDAALSLLPQSLRAALGRLHAAHDPRLSGPKFTWMASRGPSAALHQHGGVFHEHSAQTHDALDVGDGTDDGLQGGATAFLAWLPGGPLLMAARQGGDPPAASAAGWRDRVVPPPLTPPRG